jgi:hypothetical protein
LESLERGWFGGSSELAEPPRRHPVNGIALVGDESARFLELTAKS